MNHQSDEMSTNAATWSKSRVNPNLGKSEVQLFEDSEQNGIALYDETYHLHASQIDVQ